MHTCIGIASALIGPSLFVIVIIVAITFILTLRVQADDRKSVQRVDWLSLELDAMAQRWPFAAICSDPVIVETLLSAPFGIISISSDSTALADCAALARRVKDRARHEGWLLCVGKGHFAWLLLRVNYADHLQRRALYLLEALHDLPVAVSVGTQKAPPGSYPSPDVLAALLSTAHQQALAAHASMVGSVGDGSDSSLEPIELERQDALAGALARGCLPEHAGDEGERTEKLTLAESERAGVQP